MKDWNQLQTEVGEWAHKNFDFHGPQLGAAEEIGELIHAVLKNRQGIRSAEDVKALLKDAIADAFVFLSHLRHLTANGQTPHDWDKLEFQNIGWMLKFAGNLVLRANDKTTHDQFQNWLEGIATFYELNPLEITNEVWEEVKKRDWRKFPKNGLTE